MSHLSTYVPDSLFQQSTGEQLLIKKTDASYFGARIGCLIQDPNESWVEENLFSQTNLERKQP